MLGFPVLSVLPGISTIEDLTKGVQLPAGDHRYRVVTWFNGSWTSDFCGDDLLAIKQYIVEVMYNHEFVTKCVILNTRGEVLWGVDRPILHAHYNHVAKVFSDDVKK